MCECLKRADGTWHVDECCADVMDDFHAGKPHASRLVLEAENAMLVDKYEKALKLLDAIRGLLRSTCASIDPVLGTTTAAEAQRAAEEAAAGRQDCPACGGTGSVDHPEHDPSCRGDCRYCPIPVPGPCNRCDGTGRELVEGQREAREMVEREEQP